LARAPCVVAPPGGRRTVTGRTRAVVCRAGAESSRAQHPPGHLARARTAAVPLVACRPLQRSHAARGLLSRSARLPALPVPQHRTAVAVSALSRLEHLRGRTHRPCTRPDRSGGLGRSWTYAVAEEVRSHAGLLVERGRRAACGRSALPRAAGRHLSA